MPTKERWAAMSGEEKQRYRDATKRHQRNNREWWRAANSKYYRNKTEGVVSRRNVFNRTDEERRQIHSGKSAFRATRAKQARVKWDLELTEFAYKEAHHLRKLRNATTGIEWHVDHIIPLKGKHVCGLHVWNNFAVIPKVENLRKGNKYSIHEERSEGLQTGSSPVHQQA